MKTQVSRRSGGNTLVLVLFMTSVMGFTLGSYLLMVRYQNQSIMRSIAWNSCIPLSEAGIEEALTHINRSTITNLLSAGWTAAGSGFTKTRFLGDSYYITTITSADPPIVVSEGHVPLPFGSGSVGFLAPLGFLAQYGSGSSTNIQYSGRTIRVTTRKDGIWTHGMVAKDTIDFNGNNVASDSFDSTDPNWSNAGMYTTTKRRSNGDVATNSRIINSLSVGNANIYGHASTGPGGSINIGPNGGIGDIAWQASHIGIEPGWTNNDMNVAFPDVKAPFNSGFTVQSGTLDSTTFKYLLNGGDYVTAQIDISGNDVMMVTNQVRLLVTDQIKVTGNAYIEIAKGASLILYMSGANASIAGNGIANDNGYAINFIYAGLPTHTSLSFSGNGTFTGAIYAPSADFSLGGGGSTPQDFIGASVSKTVKMNGIFKFHYDESLAKTGWARGYLINSWNEI